MTTTENDSRTPRNTLTRRKMLQAAAITSSAAIAAVILPGPHSVAFGEQGQTTSELFDRAADSHPARELIDELIAAISAETVAFSTAPHNDEGQVITDAAIARVMVAKNALLAIPKREPLEDRRMATEVTLALALLQRRWLVMEGDYQSEHQRDECLMVDLLVHGTRFDAVPLLWHISGEARDSRPSDVELQSGWGESN